MRAKELGNMLLSNTVLPGFTSHSRSASGCLIGNNRSIFVSLLPFVLYQVWSHRLHKQKIQHSEFVPSAPHLLLTASNDRTIHLWDLRQVKESKPIPLITYETPATANSGWWVCMCACVRVGVGVCVRAYVRACAITPMINTSHSTTGIDSKLFV